MKNYIWIYMLSMIIIFLSCGKKEPNVDMTGTDELKSHEIDRQIRKDEKVFQDVIYVPIYSDIYADQQNPNTLLAATLSIRNTSYSDSIFISKIDYFNTDGILVRSYIEIPISLSPMATINYVIEKEDNSGGPGANFIVAMSSKNKDVKPLIQAVMIGQYGNKAFSFLTNGISIK